MATPSSLRSSLLVLLGVALLLMGTLMLNAGRPRQPSSRASARHPVCIDCGKHVRGAAAIVEQPPPGALLDFGAQAREGESAWQPHEDLPPHGDSGADNAAHEFGDGDSSSNAALASSEQEAELAREEAAEYELDDDEAAGMIPTLDVGLAVDADASRAAVSPTGAPASAHVRLGLCPRRPELVVGPNDPPRYYARRDGIPVYDPHVAGYDHIPLLALIARWLRSAGWQEAEDWTSAEVILKRVARSFPDPALFRFRRPDGWAPVVSAFPKRPGVRKTDSDLCCAQLKSNMVDCLLRAHQAQPEAGYGDLIPPTFNFPSHNVDPSLVPAFRELFERVNAEAATTPGGTPYWLVKPGAGTSGGTGIEVFDSADKVLVYTKKLAKWADTDRPVQVQKVLDNPLLINGRRFDLRVHALMASREPLVLYWNPNATAVRIAQPKGAGASGRSDIVTNYSARKGRSVDEHLWLLEQLLAHLRQLGPDKERLFWERTVPGIKRALRGVMTLDNFNAQREHSFHIWGCDFMIGSDMRPWFIECNSYPSMFQFMPRLRPRQLRMIQDTLEIAMSAPNCAYEGSSWDLVYDGQAEPRTTAMQLL